MRAFDIETSRARIHGVVGGSGPPLLLLHGIPETHVMWDDVAARLADRFTVVATDLRGFGDSSAPADIEYSMRSLAHDQVEVMAALGFGEFAVAGHDRGARCAYRMAIDHPDRVRRLAVLDIVPTGDAFERADQRFAIGYWVWTFLAAPAPVPETLIGGAPEQFVDHMLDAWSGAGFAFPRASRDRYVAQFRDPGRVRAICAQYRSAATVDTQLDLEDRTRQPIRCPTLVLWSETGPVAEWYEPLSIWREWAGAVEGSAIPAGHFLPEEAPDLVADRFARFFAPR
ncbi:alpha/beta fold hydrolase [Antrihabitans stalactiti]|uniref:Alpha/beta hydrolase n=1 Tax=Antrihabitans stalactiti TaxID=2584121 RepID=A0A848KG89_9NOCA|nr:alpha/beta hydrolase [Antrihabitans stalactiti]NMN97309.1 alpha/beta hydrolase [Antrihabitans stalactiti]